MILAIGEILLDIFPEYKALGGAPFNFSAHLKKFGYNVHFISGIGKDEEGKKIIEYVKHNDFDPDDIQINEYPTGKVIVSLDNNGIPAYNILPNAAYDYLSYEEIIKKIKNNKPDIIYTGTLIQRTENGYKTVQKLLENNKEAICFYDVNLRPGCYNQKIIESTLNYTNILKLNEEELLLLKEMLNINGNETNFIQNIFDKYPVEMITITSGENGSSIYDRNTSHTIKGSNIKTVIDTVGAGDAFASVMAIGYLQSWKISKINTMAAEFASIICGIRGAIPEDNKFYYDFQIKF